MRDPSEVIAALIAKYEIRHANWSKAQGNSYHQGHAKQAEDIVHDLREALASLSTPQPAAADVVMVPREPTQAMLDAPNTIIQPYGARLVWQRMYDAAIKGVPYAD